MSSTPQHSLLGLLIQHISITLLQCLISLPFPMIMLSISSIQRRPWCSRKSAVCIFGICISISVSKKIAALNIFENFPLQH